MSNSPRQETTRRRRAPAPPPAPVPLPPPPATQHHAQPVPRPQPPPRPTAKVVKGGASLSELVGWLDETLEIRKGQDSATNGLQVEGRERIHRVVSGVTANLALLQAALEREADLVIVHHGLLWNGLPRIVGPLRQRLALLLQHRVGLAAYHLPLDMHPALGNNVLLCAALGVVDVRPFGSYRGQLIGRIGRLAHPLALDQFMARVKGHIHPQPRLLRGGDHLVEKVAICSGGAADLVNEAIEARADVYLTGEVSEPSPALASEGRIHVIAAGHHATERFGVRAIAGALGARFDVTTEFVDIPNEL